MSTLNTTNIKHASSSSNSIVLAADGTCTAEITNRFGRNVLANGAMRVCQRDTSKSGVTSSGYHTIDTYRFVDSSIGTWTVSQDSESPTQFSKSYKMACTTANASPASSNSMRLECRLEGNQLQGFHKGTADAKPLALSFWTKTNEPGVYTVALYDHDSNRNVAANYTVSSDEATNQTWVKREVVFPADTTGAWDDDNAKSATLFFYFDVGSGFKSGTQNTSWGAASDAVTCPGMTAALGDSTSNVFYLTGIQLETDRVTDYEHRSYADELQRCKRYFNMLANPASETYSDDKGRQTIAWGQVNNVSSKYVYFSDIFDVPMRAAPSIYKVVGTSYFRIMIVGGANTTSDFDVQGTWTNCWEVRCTAVDSFTADDRGNAVKLVCFNSAARFGFSAEL